MLFIFYCGTVGMSSEEDEELMLLLLLLFMFTVNLWWRRRRIEIDIVDVDLVLVYSEPLDLMKKTKNWYRRRCCCSCLQWTSDKDTL